MDSIFQLLDIKRLSTSGYHPQTNGELERWHRTFKNMLAKVVNKHGNDWDQYLPKLLWAYRTIPHSATGESPFFLLRGMDPVLPSSTALSHPRTDYQVDVDDWKTCFFDAIHEVWADAAVRIRQANSQSKIRFDRTAVKSEIAPGDKVWVLKPGLKLKPTRKLTCLFDGPYRVLDVKESGAQVRLVDKPKDAAVFVNFDRLSKCYAQAPEVSRSDLDRRSRRVHEAPVQLEPNTAAHGHYTRSKAVHNVVPCGACSCGHG